MGNGTWRERFSDAVARSGMSQREISVAAGRAPGYVYGILKENKDPTIDNLVALADVLGVSITWLITGADVSPDQETLLTLYAGLPVEDQAALRRLAEAIAGRTDTSQ